MQTNYDRQAKLAQSAGLPQLQALSQGANPRQVRPFVALGELNARMAQMQSDKMLQGAAPPGSMPTLREKIEQSLQQLKAQAAQQQAAQQAQQQAPGMFQVPEGTPTPQMQPQAEEMAQAPADDAMQMYSGGVARLPVEDRMFGYANGGIISFFDGKRPEDKKDYEGPTDADIQEQLDRLDREAGVVRDENGRPVRRAAPAPAPKEEATSLAGDVGRTVGQGIMSAAGAVGDWWSDLTRKGELNRERLQQVPGLFEELTPSQRAARMARMKELGQQMDSVSSPTPTAAPAPAPAPKPVVGVSPDQAAAARASFAATDPRRVGIATPPPSKVVPPTTNAPVNAGDAGGAGGGASTMDDLRKTLIETLKLPGYKPSTPKSVEELDREKQTFVDKQPTSAEAQALMKHYDAMAKRYAANDEAEKAQQARNASNNLATFLMNTRGGSLGIAAGKANAALQPLLADQETRRQTFQKLRDEQEMLLGKSRYELAQAERARKEGRFDDARKHQLEVQKAETEIAKIEEQRRGHVLTGGVGLLNAEEQKRYHNILAGQNAETKRENQRRFDLQMGQRQDELDERIRNNKLNNQRLLRDLNKNIDAARVKLSRLPKDSKELAPMREEQEALIRGWQEEKQMLLDEINRPTGYDPSKVRKVGN
jgi:hypothetical protein